MMQNLGWGLFDSRVHFLDNKQLRKAYFACQNPVNADDDATVH